MIKKTFWKLISDVAVFSTAALNQTLNQTKPQN